MLYGRGDKPEATVEIVDGFPLSVLPDVVTWRGRAFRLDGDRYAELRDSLCVRIIPVGLAPLSSPGASLVSEKVKAARQLEWDQQRTAEAQRREARRAVKCEAARQRADKVVALYRSGNSSQAIASRLHIGVPTVRSILRLAGIILIPGRPPSDLSRRRLAIDAKASAHAEASARAEARALRAADREAVRR